MKATAIGASAPRPLAVDLDNTLLRTDTLVEGLAAILMRRPWRLPRVLFVLAGGRAQFKRAVARASDADYARMPCDQAVLDYVRSRRAAGGEAYLVTAADRSVADAVAAELDAFDGVIASDGALNLKAESKAAALAARFPEGFDYIGDSQAGLPVWKEARSVLVAGGSAAVRRSLSRAGVDPAQTFPRQRAGLRIWLRALRLHHWTKNGLILVPLMLGQLFLDTTTVVRTLLAFVAFGLVASGTYLLNDLCDLDADRAHPVKRNRALASGLIPLAQGLAAMPLLIAAGLGGAFALNLHFGLFTLAYAVVTLSYSFRLKAQPLVDVLTIGGLFAIRIAAGTEVTRQPQSLWLVSFTMFLFTSLALAKRHAELVRAVQDGRTVAGRGYLTTDLPLTVSLGVATAMTSVLVMLMYMELEAAMTALYAWLFPLLLTPIVLASWLLRVWTFSHRGTLRDDPVIFALKDPVSWGHAAAIVAAWAWAIVP